MTESNHITSSKLARDVVALGRKYSKTGFPNPNREGCPNRSSLRAMAYRDQRLTLNDLPASHIVSCSPCFQEYLRLRRVSLVSRGIRITAASLAAAVLLFGVGRFVAEHTGVRNEPHISEKRLAERAPASAPLPLRVDLASFSPSRGDGNADPEKKIHLPRKLLRALFLLPLGMEPGKYQVRLQDSTGVVLINKSAVARMNGGVTSVEIDIDLGNATTGRLTLMIRPPGLDWRRFPVEVE